MTTVPSDVSILTSSPTKDGLGVVYRLDAPEGTPVVSPHDGALVKVVPLGINGETSISLSFADGTAIHITGVILDSPMMGAVETLTPGSPPPQQRWASIMAGARLGKTGRAPVYVGATGPMGDNVDPRTVIPMRVSLRVAERAEAPRQEPTPSSNHHKDDSSFPMLIMMLIALMNMDGEQ